MKTDTIFYRLFQEIPSIFFELIGQSPELAESYEFSSIEVKQTAFRIDGVFLPQETTANPIYFLEVQFQPDEDLYNRLFAEICLYVRQNKPNCGWRGVVIYPSRAIDEGNIQDYEEFFLSERVRVIYLDEIEETTSLPIGIATIKLIITNEEKAITQARELINRTKQEVKSQPKQQILDIIETILIYKFPRMNREEIESMFGLSDLKQTRFYQEAREEGLEEGLEQGLEQGKLEAKLEAVPGLVGLGLSQEQIAQVLNLSIDEVRNIVEKMSR
ncbi:Rpn family recombination-promoting nuclease/putative transposase [Anabaena aphanizomenioides LEGE 00250]|uniref:Rpn family recombination-promoting nuclease/putative transposase n=1 Tax=Sphaerospermopsis aphanizomenoides LEGE 00250 TaxID=2777972 RepID=A0ABR9VC75_9CYAN|nr:Rpn family recombination-promoting nuclease/putative transposase [Sphaerospermopsis aphanizomenoides]MBE9236088.1 Rpn family recombination-promoting nuclease/putative transposase [Sphaerospermopsis aphanizomenoides LEGE 00250]